MTLDFGNIEQFVNASFGSGKRIVLVTSGGEE
jgi:hypothetical protein